MMDAAMYTHMVTRMSTILCVCTQIHTAILRPLSDPSILRFTMCVVIVSHPHIVFCNLNIIVFWCSAHKHKS